MKSEEEHDVAELKEREKTSNAIAVEKALEEEREKEAAADEKRALARKKEQEASWSYILYGYYNQTLSAFSYVGSQIVLYAGSTVSYLYHAGESIGSWGMSFFKSTPKKESVEQVVSTEQAGTLINPELSVSADHTIDENVIATTSEEVSHADITIPQAIEQNVQV
jgi:hypothetical protein